MMSQTNNISVRPKPRIRIFYDYWAARHFAYRLLVYPPFNKIVVLIDPDPRLLIPYTYVKYYDKTDLRY